MIGNDLLDAIFTDVKPKKLKLKGFYGYSMYPSIVHGDRLHLDYEDIDEISDRDVVVLKNSSGRIMIHRYCDQTKRTKGDASLFYDQADFEVLAKVKKISTTPISHFNRHKYKMLYFNPEEIQLVLALSRNYFSEIKDDINLANVDFDKLLKWIRSNELSLFFASQIDDWRRFPQSFEAALLWDFEANHQKLMFMFDAYARIKEDFFLMGVPFIPMKGIDFNSRYYSDPYQRNLSDVDIMIEGLHLDRVIETLSKNDNYQLLCTDFSKKYEHHIQVRLPKYNNLLLEIHFKHSYLNLEKKWGYYFTEGIINQTTEGIKFSDEANICILSASFFTSSGEYFKSILDAYRIFSNSEVNLVKLFRIARELGCRQRVVRFLSVVTSFFPEVLPNQKRGKRAKVRDGFIRSFMFSEGLTPRLKRVIFRTFLFESPSDYISYCLKKIRIAIR